MTFASNQLNRPLQDRNGILQTAQTFSSVSFFFFILLPRATRIAQREDFSQKKYEEQEEEKEAVFRAFDERLEEEISQKNQ